MVPPDYRPDPSIAIPERETAGHGAVPPPPRPAVPPKAKPKPKPKRRRAALGAGFASLMSGLFALISVAVIAAGVAGFAFWRQVMADLPDYRWLADYQPAQMSRIYAADSRLMAELATERRIFVPIEAIPKTLQAAFIGAEDQRFWEHNGVDPIGIVRAVITNAEQYGSGRRAVGASTITQQVAKNMLVGSERSITRKLKEAILATRIEEALPKERILEIYLNEIFMGAQAYGVAAAAQAYFNKGLDELTIGEMAFLGALPKAPNNLNPVRFPEAARIRRDYVLDRMAEDGAITRADADQAKTQPIVPKPTRRPEVLPVGQYFTEDVRRELIGRFGEKEAVGGGLVVRTTLDPELQAQTEQILRRGLLAFDRSHGGWLGPVAKIPAGATEWFPAMATLPRTGGPLPEWKFAVALEVRDREARMAWIERPDPSRPPVPRIGTLTMGDVGWSRKKVSEEKFRGIGGMRDVVQAGDVVMVEQLGGANSTRLALRQTPEIEGAIVALDPTTGRVLAMAGGWSFEKSQFNRASQAMRQPGSSFKPFVYLPALEAGVTPATRFLDGPIEIRSGNKIWRPTNYGGGTGRGYVSVRQALESSLNLVTIRVAMEVGMSKVAETASRFGVSDNLLKVYANALGAGETTVLRMAGGYGGLASGGRKVVPTLIDSIQDRRGHVVWRSETRACDGCDATDPNGGVPLLADARPQIANPIAVYQMTNMLTGVVQSGTGKRAQAGRPIAGKTGTTNDYQDNWFVGYTPDLVVAVWLGYDDPRPLGRGETGGENAAPIFRQVVQAALKNSPAVPFRAPNGVALVKMAGGKGGQITEAFVPGTEQAARAAPPPPKVAKKPSGGMPDQGLGGLY